MEPQLTIVIPTKNRAPFLARALGYYRDVGCPYPILLGDSSDPEHLEPIMKLIDAIGDRLEIHHLIDPGATQTSAAGWQTDTFLRDLITHVETPYVALYADDDFAVVNNLTHGIEFLKTHQDYSFVCGDAAWFALQSGTANGKLAGLARYLQHEYAADTPKARLDHLLRNYTVLEYGISRTAEKKFRWGKVFEAEVDNLTGELINCCLVVMQGKVKQLDQLFLVRQAHGGQTSLAPGDVFDWSSGVLFPDRYQKLRDIISDELTTRMGLSPESANDTFKRAFWYYLSKSMWASHPENKLAAGGSNTWKLAGRVPGAQNLARKIRDLSGRGISLKSALNPASPHHSDFMPVYRAITAANGT